MSLVGSQQQTFLRLLATLQPHWHRDSNLPARIQTLLASHRAFGSRDRRLYRELIYTTLRYLPWIEPWLDRDSNLACQIVAWLAADLPATRAFRGATCGDWPPCPSTIAEKVVALRSRVAVDDASFGPLLPEWVRTDAPWAFSPPDYDALNSRASLWLRLQTDDPTRVFEEFVEHGWAFRRSELVPDAVELLGEVDVSRSEAYQRGQVEVQDLGSQLILLSAGVQPGGRWFDACAGAGGKSLQLARLLGTSGHVRAYDIRPAALQELRARASRAEIRNIATPVAAPNETFDGVLVDAPCSGSGTWRRSPHLKWTTTSAQIDQAAATQRELLARYATRVRPGGQLVYATCSLSRRENEDVIASFLSAGPEFSIAPLASSFGFASGELGLTIRPARHNTDGFFLASLRRRG